ncbi:GNAT family N-acetyltransferase [Sporichthya polymorpha]|uniref:GNAT family N-acetyltransferase n=1 Tax=Sporichthya polymorpha TaxID=35751 RepID=UPI000688A709|nr:GNAT family N-acetyltransferase [Sporichthya polymorpha]
MSDVRLRGPRPGDWGWIISRHGALYFAEYGWGTDYEAYVAHAVGELAEHFDPAREAVWIAELDDRPVGSIACARKDEETAQLRFFLAEPDARGRGVGLALIRACLEFATEVGYRRMMLWTCSGLVASRALYARHGFTLESEPGPFPYDATRTEQILARDL